jgi:hypothetical protein
VLGLSQQRPFQQYHRVLSRAVWSSLAVSRLLFARLVVTFLPTGSLVFGVDETIERRWGAKIAARGIYRDAARSSDSHLVKTSGLRWVTLHLLVEVPWTERVWALPVLTALAPSERYHHTRGQRHKTLTDWGTGDANSPCRCAAGGHSARSPSWAIAPMPRSTCSAHSSGAAGPSRW